MIMGFDYSAGYLSKTYDTDAYRDELPPDLIAIGAALALDSYIHHGPSRRGYDAVTVTILDPGAPPAPRIRPERRSIHQDGAALCL